MHLPFLRTGSVTLSSRGVQAVVAGGLKILLFVARVADLNLTISSPKKGNMNKVQFRQP
jgi:hypothetical protein